jgi:hypothetical protein
VDAGKWGYLYGCRFRYEEIDVNDWYIREGKWGGEAIKERAIPGMRPCGEGIVLPPTKARDGEDIGVPAASVQE